MSRPAWPRIRLMLFAAVVGLTITTPLLLLMRAAAVVVLWLWVLWRGTGKGPAAVMLVAMLAIGWTYSASGHASAWGDFSLAQLIDGMHVASTAVWVGGLLVLATSARPLFLTGHDRAYALETSERLSRLAGLALLGVVLTGIYNAVTQIGFLSALWETAYGRLLLLKLVGVLGIAACRCGTGPRDRPSPVTRHRAVSASCASPPWNRSWPSGSSGARRS